MKVKRSLLMLCIAAGLSLSVLQKYGYSQTSESTVPTANDTAPHETVSNENSEQNFYILLLLLNIIALLGAIGTCAFLVYKNNKLNQINKEDNAFLIKLEPEEAQQTNEQVQAKQELDSNLKKIQDSLQEIKDSFCVSENLETNKKNTTIIALSQEKYIQLVDWIHKLGCLLDDTYIAMLRYNDFSKYDQALNIAIETIQQSISEHIKGLENSNKDNNKIDQNEIKQAIDSSLTTIHPKIDRLFQKLQSFSSHYLQNATQASDNTLTEEERQLFNNRIHQLNYRIQELNIERDKYEKKLEEERNQYEQEIQVKNDKIAELETGEIGKIKQEYDDLFKDYKNAYQYYEKYQTMKTERDNINTQLKQSVHKYYIVRQELLDKIDEKNREMQEKNQQIQQKDNEINQLKGDVQRFRKIIDKKPTKNNRKDELNSELNEVKQELQEIIEKKDQEILGKREKTEGEKRNISNNDTKNSDYSYQWQALVNLYMQNPEEIRNNAIDEVMEDDDNLMERKMNPSRTLIFNHSKSPGGYYIIAVGDDYFLFPKQHGIPVSQKSTAREVFDGYKTGNTSKFTLIIPAQVIRCNNERWQLINKGRLEYS